MGRKVQPEVQEAHLVDRDAHPEVWEGSRKIPEGPGGVGSPTRRSGRSREPHSEVWEAHPKVQESHPEVREGSGSAPRGPEGL